MDYFFIGLPYNYSVKEKRFKVVVLTLLRITKDMKEPFFIWCLNYSMFNYSG